MLNPYLEQAIKDLSNRKVEAFLKVIRAGEGTAGKKGYNTGYGYRYFGDLSRKPGRITKAGGYTSSAEGAYQFLNKTWDAIQKKLDLPSFSPLSQDLAAVALLRQRGAIDPIKKGDIDTALHRSAPEWASLPTKEGRSYYGQPVKARSTLHKVFNKALSAIGLGEAEASVAPTGTETVLKKGVPPTKRARPSMQNIDHQYTDPKTGKVYLINGPADATEEELRASLGEQGATKPVPNIEHTVRDRKTGKEYRISGPADATQQELELELEAYKDRQMEYVKQASRSGGVSSSEHLRRGVVGGIKGVGQSVGLVTPKEMGAYEAQYKPEAPDEALVYGVGEGLPGVGIGAAAGAGTSAVLGKALSALGPGVKLSQEALNWIMKAGTPGLEKVLAMGESTPGLPSRIASSVLKVARPLLEGAAAGAAAGYVTPSPDDKQGEYAAKGAFLNAAIPVALRTAALIPSFVGSQLLPRFVNQRAGTTVLDMLGEKEALKTIDALRKTPIVNPLFDTQHTIPATVGNVELSSLQKGLARKYPARFTELERMNDARRRAFLRSRTLSKEEIADLKLNRQATAQRMLRDMEGDVDLEGLRTELEDQASGMLAGGSKRAVVEDMIKFLPRVEKLDDGTTRLISPDKLDPVHRLIEMRDELKSGLKGVPTKAFTSAPAASAVAVEQKKLLENELREATDGAWDNYIKTYQSLSEPYNEAEAMHNISKRLGGKSKWNQDLVRHTIESNIEGEFGKKVSAPLEKQLYALADDLARQEAPLTAGTYSNAELNKNLEAIAKLEGPVIGYHNTALGLLRGAQVLGKSAHEKALLEMMLNPEVYNKNLAMALRKKVGPSPRMRAFKVTTTLPIVENYLGDDK